MIKAVCNCLVCIVPEAAPYLHAPTCPVNPKWAETRPVDPVADLVAERGRTHGDWTYHAEIAQTLKRYMHVQPSWAELANFEREALDMIAHKIGRVLAGDPHFVDHWDDIAGYARITADRNRPSKPD